jgi:membrane protein YqaA with SNARE-associated domain
VKSIKHLFVRYKVWIMHLLAPLSGPWAVFAVAFIDASIFGIPIDPIVAYYVATDPRHCLLFAVIGSAGSALGSTVPYLIGYKGGEALVAKRIGRQRFARMHAMSEKYGDLALIIPALMPPGFPFKAFALMGGVTEMSYLHFELAIFAGRLLRFLILGGLVIAYGPEILDFLMEVFRHHRIATFATIAAVVVIIIVLVRLFGSRGNTDDADTETIVA